MITTRKGSEKARRDRGSARLRARCRARKREIRETVRNSETVRLRSAGEEPEDEVGLNNVLGHDGNIKAIIMKHPMKLLWCCIGVVSCMVIRTPPPPWGRGGRGRGKLWLHGERGQNKQGQPIVRVQGKAKDSRGKGSGGQHGQGHKTYQPPRCCTPVAFSPPWLAGGVCPLACASLIPNIPPI